MSKTIAVGAPSAKPKPRRVSHWAQTSYLWMDGCRLISTSLGRPVRVSARECAAAMSALVFNPPVDSTPIVASVDGSALIMEMLSGSFTDFRLVGFELSIAAAKGKLASGGELQLSQWISSESGAVPLASFHLGFRSLYRPVRVYGLFATLENGIPRLMIWPSDGTTSSYSPTNGLRLEAATAQTQILNLHVTVRHLSCSSLEFMRLLENQIRKG